MNRLRAIDTAAADQQAAAYLKSGRIGQSVTPVAAKQQDSDRVSNDLNTMLNRQKTNKSIDLDTAADELEKKRKAAEVARQQKLDRQYKAEQKAESTKKNAQQDTAAALLDSFKKSWGVATDYAKTGTINSRKVKAATENKVDLSGVGRVVNNALLAGKEQAQTGKVTAVTADSEAGQARRRREQSEYLAKYTNKEYQDNAVGQALASYRSGRLQQDSALAWNEYLTNPTNANREYAEAIDNMIARFQVLNIETLKDDASMPWLTRSLAGYLPQFVDQTKATVGGALAGGAAGSAIPVVGTAAGMKAGAAAGSGLYSFSTMRGSAFKSLMELGVDEETARKAATDEAIISALIEMADTGVDIATLGIGSVINTVTRGGLKALVKKGAEETAEAAWKKVAKGLAKYGLNVGGEMVEEGAQQAVSIANQRQAQSGEKPSLAGLAGSAAKTAVNTATGKDPEAADQIWQAAKEGGKIAAMMFPAGVVGRTAVQKGLGGSTQSAQSGSAAQVDKDITRPETTTQRRGVGRVSGSLEEFETAYRAQRNPSATDTEVQEQFELFKGYAKGFDTVETAQGPMTRTQIKKLLSSLQDETEIDREVDRLLDEGEAKSVQAKYFGERAGLVKDENWKKAHLRNRDSRVLDAMGKVTGTEIRYVPTIDDGTANAKYENGVIYLALDAEDPVMTSLVHETIHRIRETDSEIYNVLSSFVQTRMSENSQNRSLALREDLYETSDLDTLTEEVVADAFGRMLNDSTVLEQFVQDNRTAAEKVLDVVRDIINAVQRALNDQNLKLSKNQIAEFRDLQTQMTGMEQLFSDALNRVHGTTKNTATEGGGIEKLSRKTQAFSEDKYFARQMDKWEELEVGKRLKVGDVGKESALNLVGLPASGMYFDIGKIKKAMEKHGDHLSPDVLKRIPELLNDPIVVAEYVGPNGIVKNTVNVYGDLFVGGKPIVVGVVMRLDRSGQGIINNIRTIHARGNAAKQITDNSVLYLNEDKKKTRKWFQVCGNLSVPLEGTKFGLIRSISFDDESVNAKSSKKGRAQLNDYIIKYGAIPQGERPASENEPQDREAEMLVHGSEKVSAHALGIANGTKKQSVYPVEVGETEATWMAKQLAQQQNLALVLFVGGDLEVKKGKVTFRTPIFSDDEKLYVRADHPIYTAAQLVGGENGKLGVLEKDREEKYTELEENRLLKTYKRNVESGWISPNASFENYLNLYRKIQTEIVGQRTRDGIEITGQREHFMQRVLGTAIDPEKYKKDHRIIRRSGVSLEDIKNTLFRPTNIDKPVTRSDGKRSVRYIGENYVVTINPDTGELIQTNLRKKGNKDD